jgi:hypothetical protein
MALNQRRTELYRIGNLEAAHIILQDVAQYGGNDALLVEWARRIMLHNPEPPGGATILRVADQPL